MELMSSSAHQTTIFATPPKCPFYPGASTLSGNNDAKLNTIAGLSVEACDKNATLRFKASFGPDHDWIPDHNWGGSMVGLQSMIIAPPRRTSISCLRGPTGGTQISAFISLIILPSPRRYKAAKSTILT